MRTTLALDDELVSEAQRLTGTQLMALIERRGLYRRGIGYVDAQLLAATLLTEGAALWTRDGRLAVAAADLGIAAVPSSSR